MGSETPQPRPPMSFAVHDDLSWIIIQRTLQTAATANRFQPEQFQPKT